MKYQLIRYNGQLCYITAATEVINAEQLIMDKKYSLLLYCIAHPNKKVTVKGNVYRLTDVCREQFFTGLMKEFVSAYAEKLNERYPLYAKYAEGVVAYIESEKFSALPLYSEKEACKAAYILNLLNLTKACSTCLDMKKYAGKTSWGRLNGKTIYKNKVDWIDTSVTGIYRAEVKGGE